MIRLIHVSCIAISSHFRLYAKQKGIRYSSTRDCAATTGGHQILPESGKKKRPRSAGVCVFGK
jgi:hypothetical protein